MQRLKFIWWLVAGIIGSVEFWLFQVRTGSSTIPQFMGEQIVAQGGYPKLLTLPIGWGVHLGVSLGYSFLFAIIMLIPFSRSPFARLGIGAGIALVLGWFATLLTAPAITATISVLSGQGFPATLPGLNTTLGLPLWNHLLFFGVVWVVCLLIPSLFRIRRLPAKSEPKLAPMSEPKLAPMSEPKPAPKSEPKLGPKSEPKPAPKSEPKLEPWYKSPESGS